MDNIPILIFANRSYPGLITITDAAGKTVFSQKIKLSAGNNIADFGSFRYAAGIYYIAYTNENGKKEVVRFVKL